MRSYDLVIRDGTVVNASETAQADVAINGGSIAAIGRDLAPGKREIDASGKYIMPGGVDAHAHIEQLSASGLINSDTFESATKSAALGGTTTVLCFAAQHVGMSLTKVVEDYHALARRGAIIDYAFHMILADPREEVLRDELPPLIKSGHSSLKVFMTYDRLRVDDVQLLDVLMAARENKALVLVHAENHGMITWLSKRLLAKGYTAPRYHAVSHPRSGEAEAFTRLIAFAEFIDQPIMIYHVSSAEGVAVIRAARGRGLKVFAETCPQYLFLTKQDLDKPGIEGAKWMCSPPVREASDQEALWQALDLGALQLVSSDHAPYAFNEKGKLMAGTSANFKQIPNGMPGVQTRLPLLFDAMVSNARFGAERFVEWTAAAPAHIYGLAPRKGAVAVGADADIVLWDPDKQVTISDANVVDGAGYTPYIGRTVRGWPVTVLRRGEIIAENGSCLAQPGSGEFLARDAGAAAEPLGRLSPEFDPARNFGAQLY
jgi:dihydropyrimidinase